MKKLAIYASLFTFFTTFSQGQEKKVEITPYGFVKTDAFWDSRQTVTAREGHLLLYPAPEVLGTNGEDINAQPGHNILAIQSRVGISLSGPEAFGAKVAGRIEGAFFGQSNSNVNGFRLRHAYAKLIFPKTELLAGQTWNPFFNTGCFPGTISFNTGLPIQSFSRNPQLRITHSLGDFKVIVAAAGQRDFKSAGESNALRNTMAPDSYLKIHYGFSNPETGTDFLTGIGAEYKVIRPRLQSEMGYTVDETVGSYAFQGFLKLKVPAITMKFQGVYGQNLHDLMMISSYAIKDEDPITGERTYAPLSSYAIWTDIHTNGKIQGGVFAGYTKNTGAGETVIAPIGSRSNIDNVWRISPRASVTSGAVKIAAELEVTSAAFGDFSSNGVVDNETTVTNYRLLLSGIYSF